MRFYATERFRKGYFRVEYSLTQMDSSEGYRLLTSLVVPRPIAWITSLSAEGVVNAAPYSFFNLLGSNPPIVAIGVGNRKAGIPKDTASNIEQLGEFVVNLVDEATAEAMNITAIEFPEGVSELTEAQLTTVPSAVVQVPRIGESPVNLECRLAEIVQIGGNRVIFGEVVHIAVRDGETPETLRPIGRMGGGGGYVRTTDRFQMPRIPFERWEPRS
jgi:flavin reductase (DIM6/NTAB) family NADH-FMN oxidoreductase RutF